MFIYLEWGIFPSTYGHTKKYRTDGPEQAEQSNVPRQGISPALGSILLFLQRILFPWLGGWRSKGHWCGPTVSVERR